ncbi:MAG: type II toxin-antitoxin system VapC family toxin [Actinomycetia bacterium]|nr:type II toxin-antitoxin system VapC family toxin [Actinomycetes bacterium]
MRLLLDTNVALAIGNGTEPASVTRLVDDPKNECYLSAVVLWEIAIKAGIGKLNIGMELTEFADEFAAHNYQTLDVQPKHVFGLSTLPTIHKDPFDRLLIAQAQRENMTLVTTDALLAQYGSAVRHIADRAAQNLDTSGRSTAQP